MQAVLKALTRIPLWLTHGIARLIDGVAFHVMRWRRDRAERDVANAFPEKSAAARARIVRDSYRNLADTLVEAFWGFGASAEALGRRVAFENPEVIARSIVARESVILLTAHFANWEWLALAANTYFGINMDIVYQRPKVEAIDTFLCQVRGRFGNRFIPREEFIFHMMSHADEARAYALIADQTPKHKQDPKHWTRFLNQDTAFFKGAGKMAQFLEARVLYVSMRRVRRGYYSVRFIELAAPPYESDSNELIVERYAQNLERDIRASPADWLWLQNKWKVAKPTEVDISAPPLPPEVGGEGRTS